MKYALIFMAGLTWFSSCDLGKTLYDPVINLGDYILTDGPQFPQSYEIVDSPYLTFGRLTILMNIDITIIPYTMHYTIHHILNLENAPNRLTDTYIFYFTEYGTFYEPSYTQEEGRLMGLEVSSYGNPCDLKTGGVYVWFITDHDIDSEDIYYELDRKHREPYYVFPQSLRNHNNTVLASLPDLSFKKLYWVGKKSSISSFSKLPQSIVGTSYSGLRPPRHLVPSQHSEKMCFFKEGALDAYFS